MAAQLCRECGEGKHGACDGGALIEIGLDVQRVDCLCSDKGHPADVVGPVMAERSRSQSICAWCSGYPVGTAVDGLGQRYWSCGAHGRAA